MENIFLGLQEVGFTKIIFAVVMVAIFVGLVFKFVDLKNDGTYENDEEYETYLNALRLEEKNLIAKIERLEESLNSLEVREYNRKLEFSPEQQRAVTTFDRQGIALPTDILEEIIYLSPTTFEETVKLIEAKRQNLKAELSKKLFI